MSNVNNRRGYRTRVKLKGQHTAVRNTKRGQAVLRDSFENVKAALGSNVDPLLSSINYTDNLNLINNREKLENMYTSSWVLGRGIETLASDMTKKGIEIVSDLKPDDVKAIHKEIFSLDIYSSLSAALCWGKLYGGAIAYIDIKGEDTTKELNVDAIKKGSFKGLRVFDRWRVYPELSELIEDGPQHGMPMYYYVNLTSEEWAQAYNGTQNPSNMTGALKLHHTRVFRFIGTKLPFYKAQSVQLWGAPIVTRFYDRLIGYDAAILGTASLVMKNHLKTVKIKDFRKILAAGGGIMDALMGQIKVMASSEHNNGYTLVDLEDEVTAMDWNMGGVPETLVSLGEQIAGALQMPLYVLLGQPPSGLSTNTEEDLKNYFETVANKQEAELRRPLSTILSVLMMHLGIDIEDARDVDFTFNSLFTLTDEQKVNIAYNAVNTITSAEGAGLLSKATAAKELKEQSTRTGYFTNIKDEDIDKLADDVAEPADDDLSFNEEAYNEEQIQSNASPEGQDAQTPKEGGERSEPNTERSTENENSAERRGDK